MMMTTTTGLNGDDRSVKRRWTSLLNGEDRSRMGEELCHGNSKISRIWLDRTICFSLATWRDRWRHGDHNTMADHRSVVS